MEPVGLVLVALAAVLFLTIGGKHLYPPWTRQPAGGVNFNVPGADNVADLHGDMNGSELVVFFGGNQFMVLPEIMEAFRAEYPQYRKLFYETLPPGILEKQIETGSLVIGNLEITHRPDLFVAGHRRLKKLDDTYGYFDAIKPYYRNRLAIMVFEGNPKGIRSLTDLGREDVQVSMPNPETEGIANQAVEAFRKARGDDLVRMIMETKVKKQTTFITQIHHRETPMRIMEGTSDAGPVWQTEAIFQKMIGNPIEMIEIPETHNVLSTTAAGIMRAAPHRQAAKDFLAFLTSERSWAVYAKFGFEPIGK